MDIIFSRLIVDYISGYGKSYQLYKCNNSDILPRGDGHVSVSALQRQLGATIKAATTTDILPSTTSRRVVINLKVNTSIAIISIYIPVELTFDATLIKSKGLFGKIKKWENCNFS